MPSALNWFQIPAADGPRARAFYETICDVGLQELMPGGPMQMWGFPVDASNGEIGGCIVAGEGAVPSAAGTVVFLRGDPDLQVVLDRVEGAGGRILMPKTKIDDETGYFAMIADTEGNTVGLHSMG
jgi:uncharacterized protein